MLKPVGNICKVDRLGRIVIPVNVRKMFDLSEGSPLELLVDDDKIVFRKYLPNCTFCGTTDNLTEFKGNHICADCLDELSK